MSFIKDLLFPKFCLGCGFIGEYICSNCSKKLLSAEQDTCLYCNKPSVLGITHKNCSKKEGVDGFLYFYYYNNTLKNILKNIKYRLVKEAFTELLSHMGDEGINKIKQYVKIYPNPRFQSIPLTSQREKQRGFNQASIITTFLLSFFPLVSGNYLIKVNNTLPQAQIKDKNNRQKNILNSFQVINKNELIHKNIFLVDDVVTTGSTTKEAARVLKREGAKKVCVVALAKG